MGQTTFDVPAGKVDGDVGVLNTKVGDLSSLTTTAKTNLVSAVNEIDSDVSALSSQKVFGMSKITASSLDDLKTKLTALADTMASETSTELVLVTTPAFDVFPNGTHSFTFHKLASTYYWGYGYVANHIVTLSRSGNTWTFSNDYNTLNSQITNQLGTLSVKFKDTLGGDVISVVRSEEIGLTFYYNSNLPTNAPPGGGYGSYIIFKRSSTQARVIYTEGTGLFATAGFDPSSATTISWKKTTLT